MPLVNREVGRAERARTPVTAEARLNLEPWDLRDPLSWRGRAPETGRDYT